MDEELNLDTYFVEECISSYDSTIDSKRINNLRHEIKELLSDIYFLIADEGKIAIKRFNELQKQSL